MGYMHINNLYRDQTILMFKECYALEKIHGTSAKLIWDNDKQKLRFFSGMDYERFKGLFDISSITEKCKELFPDKKVVIYGEFYGNKIMGFSKIYGDEYRFTAFDVQINDVWLNVPNADDVCQKLGVEFVDYVRCNTDIDTLNAERDKESTQAIRNGCGPGKKREGVVLRPLMEFVLNDSRIICKHKQIDFIETATQREVTQEELKVLSDAREIANEWVTEMRLTHVLSHFSESSLQSISALSFVVPAMIEDVYREGKGELIESKAVEKEIGKKTTLLFKRLLK